MKSVNQYVMKDSGVQWIGAVPEHWEVCKVKNKYSFSTGFTPPKNNEEYYDYSNEGYTWICISDMKAKEIECSANSISRYYVDTFKPAIVKKGSLLYSFKLSVGQVSFAKKDLFTNEAIVSFHDLDSVCLPYLYYSSQICIIQNAETNIYGAKLLNQERIKEATILFPPLSEQRAIADWLDAKCADIDAAIELQQRMIDKLKAYKTAVIHQAVTKGLDKNLKPTDLKDSGIKWLGMIPKHWDVVLVKNILRWKSVKGCGEKEVLSLYREYGVIPKSSRDDNHNITSDNTDDYKLVEKGDFVINKMKAWQGSMGVSLYEGIISPAYYVCSFINEKVYKPYFHYLMRDSSYLPEYKRLSGGIRVGQWDLAYDKFKSLPALLPPILAEQRAIADWLDAKCADIDAIIALKEQKQEKLKAYKKTIIFEYVTGKKQVANINKQL